MEMGLKDFWVAGTARGLLAWATSAFWAGVVCPVWVCPVPCPRDRVAFEHTAWRRRVLCVGRPHFIFV